MERFFKKILLLSILLISCSSAVFAATGNELTNVTEFKNDTFIVKYGSILSLRQSGTLTSNDTNKAVVKNNSLFITGTGNFSVKFTPKGLPEASGEQLNFYSWNATVDNGRYWVYTDSALRNKESILYPKTYLELADGISGESFKVVSNVFSSGKYSKELAGKYIENRANDLSYYNYSFEKGFNDAFEPIALPIKTNTPDITGNEFSNITRFYNNTYIVKYGTVLRLNGGGTITSRDTSKAEIKESDLVYIKGTGSFKITLVKNGKTMDLNFFAWNAYMQKGSHTTYLDVNKNQADSELYSKVYLALATTSNSDTFKINDHLFIDGHCERTVNGRYLKSYLNNPGSYYIYAFDTNYDNIPPKPVIAPSTPSTPPADYFYDPEYEDYNPFAPPSSSPLNDKFLPLAKECITWLSRNRYQYSQGNRIPPYSSGGLSSSSWKPKGSREIDCSSYISWVLYEYGRRNNVPSLTNTFSGYQKNSGWFHSLAKELGKGKTNGYRQYFELVWLRGKHTTDRSKIKSLCKPGDIFIYREGVGHVEIFVSGWSGNSCKIYNCGMAPSGKYDSGAPRSRNMGSSSGHGFWDLSAVIRLKGTI